MKAQRQQEKGKNKDQRGNREFWGKKKLQLRPGSLKG